MRARSRTHADGIIELRQVLHLLVFLNGRGGRKGASKQGRGRAGIGVSSADQVAADAFRSGHLLPIDANLHSGISGRSRETRPKAERRRTFSNSRLRICSFTGCDQRSAVALERRIRCGSARWS